MNDIYFNEYCELLNKLLNIAVEEQYSLPSLARSISCSRYFQAIEEDLYRYAPVIDEDALVKEIYPELKCDLKKYSNYVECEWASMAYLYIQGETGYTFEFIFLYIPIGKMIGYFPVYHEMGFNHIIDRFNELVEEESALTKLSKKYKYSLKFVSDKTGIPHKTLLSLNKRKRDIKKLSVAYAITLARLFNVRIETLTEFVISDSFYISNQPGLVDKIKEGGKEDISKMPIYNPNEKW